MPPSNLTVLTKSHQVIAAKKRAKKEQIKEVLFDEDARREFLTGFHKRKLAKAQDAKKKAIEKEKQARLQVRREQRALLRERATQNAKEVEQAHGMAADDEDDWDSALASHDKGKGKQVEDEYEGEEILATVTVVEDFNPDDIIYGRPTPSTSAPLLTAGTNKPNPSLRNQDRGTLDIRSKQSRVDAATGNRANQVSRSKVKYGTKDSRKVDRKKQRARRAEKAERAGGKAERGKGKKGRSI